MSNLENIFASRFLRAGRSNRLLSFLSIISVVGVILGVATLIIVVCVMDGFTKNLKENFLGSNPHIIITNMNGKPLENWRRFEPLINSVNGVRGSSPFIFGQAMLSSGSEISGVFVRGIDPGIEKKVGGLKDTIVRGDLESLNDDKDNFIPGILAGQEIVFTSGIFLGNDVTLISPKMNKSAFGFIPKMKKFRLDGFFDTGIHDHNSSFVYINIKDAQDFFMLGDGVSAISVYVNNPDNVVQISDDISKVIREESGGEMVRVSNWLVSNGALFTALKLEQFAMFIILTLIIIVASFNIVSMITVTVKDKKKEVAIIRAMGGSELLISRIFIRQGLIIGIIGTFLGDLIALIILFVLKNFEIIKIPKEIYHSSTIPVHISLFIFVIVTFSSIFITYVASAIPAKIFAKLNPIEAIRND